MTTDIGSMVDFVSVKRNARLEFVSVNSQTPADVTLHGNVHAMAFRFAERDSQFCKEL